RVEDLVQVGQPERPALDGCLGTVLRQRLVIYLPTADCRLPTALEQALEGRRSKDLLLRPFAVLDLSSQPRLDEDRPLRRVPRFERDRLTPQRLQLPEEVVEHPLGEAGADAARVEELPLLVVHAGEKRADRALAPALARHPTADHDLRLQPVLDLDPGPAAATGLVARVEPLGYDSLQALVEGRVAQGLPLAAVVGRGLPVRPPQL